MLEEAGQRGLTPLRVRVRVPSFSESSPTRPLATKVAAGGFVSGASERACLTFALQSCFGSSSRNDERRESIILTAILGDKER